MTAEEIRKAKFDDHADGSNDTFFLREIAAQLAELNHRITLLIEAEIARQMK